ncbi:MAG: hypothetical protein ACFFG0_03680 [Candidatus Thorarchaeota archaeon]
MKIFTKTIYQAKDDREFDNKKDCIDHENLIDEIDELLKTLPELPKDSGCSFSNGGGYIQHDKEIFLSFQAEMIKIVCRFTKISKEAIDNLLKHQLPLGNSIIGRYVCDCCDSIIKRAWFRISCTSDEFREYGQPYYALNPEKAKKGCLNLKEKKD